MIAFDPTVNLGTVLSFFGFVIGGLGVVFTLRTQVTALADRMGSVEAELKKMSDVLVELGRQDERMSSMDRRLSNIETSGARMSRMDSMDHR
jgi:hypothetical protein